MTVKGAAFFDRDGVINVDTGYIHRIEDLAWVEDSPAAIRRCNEAGLLVFIVTNQRGIALGLYDEVQLAAFHAHMLAELARVGARVDDLRHCPHDNHDGCDCRKPKPGMVLDLMKSWPVNPRHSFLVGDKESDVEAARAAGIAGYRYGGGSLLALVEHAIFVAGASRP